MLRKKTMLARWDKCRYAVHLWNKWTTTTVRIVMTLQALQYSEALALDS